MSLKNWFWTLKNCLFLEHNCRGLHPVTSFPFHPKTKKRNQTSRWICLQASAYCISQWKAFPSNRKFIKSSWRWETSYSCDSSYSYQDRFVFIITFLWSLINSFDSLILINVLATCWEMCVQIHFLCNRWIERSQSPRSYQRDAAAHCARGRCCCGSVGLRSPERTRGMEIWWLSHPSVWWKYYHHSVLLPQQLCCFNGMTLGNLISFWNLKMFQDRILFGFFLDLRKMSIPTLHFT